MLAGWYIAMAHILIAAPQYIAGVMTLGVLMQAAQAFQRLTTALSWPIDNLGELARCRASIDRVASLYEDMLALERAEARSRGRERIAVCASPHPELELRRLRLQTPAGELLLDDFDLRVRRGERVLICGDPAVTISLFKAVAGLWPWGSGEVRLPAGRDLMFVPRQPFLPAGSLRMVLSYPDDADRHPDAVLERALECAGIAWLAPKLDTREDWGRELPLRIQQRLGLARVFLHQPAWIFIEEATDALAPKEEVDSLELLHHELPSSTLLVISRRARQNHFFERRLLLQRPRAGVQPPAAHAARPEAPSLPEA